MKFIVDSKQLEKMGTMLEADGKTVAAGIANFDNRYPALSVLDEYWLEASGHIRGYRIIGFQADGWKLEISLDGRENLDLQAIGADLGEHIIALCDRHVGFIGMADVMSADANWKFDSRGYTTVLTKRGTWSENEEPLILAENTLVAGFNRRLQAEFGEEFDFDVVPYTVRPDLLLSVRLKEPSPEYAMRLDDLFDEFVAFDYNLKREHIPNPHSLCVKTALADGYFPGCIGEEIGRVVVSGGMYPEKKK